MSKIDERYVSVFNYDGVDIYTLKGACPAKGDTFGYLVKTPFGELEYDTVSDAIKAISYIKRGGGKFNIS